MKTYEVSREELYGKVWAKPLKSVATEYETTMPELIKLCNRHGIPRPTSGHWATVAAKKPVSQMPLLEREGDEMVLIYCYSEGAGGGDRCKLTVQDKLMNPHPLIRKTRQILEGALKGTYAVYEPFNGSLGVYTGKDSRQRALRILNTLILELEARGYEVSSATKGRGATIVSRSGAEVGLLLREKVARKTVEDKAYSRRTYEYQCTGELYLEIDTFTCLSQYRWADGKHQRLEQLLGKVIAGLEIAVEKRRLYNIREQHEKELEAARRAEQERRIREFKAEQERVSHLLFEADQWRKSRNIDAYIDASIAVFEERGVDLSLGTRQSQWVAWARDQAARLDPLRASPKSILDDRALANAERLGFGALFGAKRY